MQRHTSWRVKILALCSPFVILVSFGILISSVFYLGCGFDWTLVLFRALFAFIGLGIALVLQRNPAVKKVLEQSKEDGRIIAAHWAQDPDLIRLTWALRASYCMVAIILLVCLNVFMPYECNEMSKLGWDLAFNGADEATCMRETNNYFYASSTFFLWSTAMVLHFITATVQFLAALHIIFYRNNPVKDVFVSMCKECYKYSSIAVAIGVPTATTAHMAMAAMPWVKTTTFINLASIYLPFSQGYGYPLGSSIPHVRDTFLIGLPNYNPRDLLGEEYILDANKQEDFIHENIADIRKKFSISQLQAMGIDPSMISKYGK